VRRALDANPRTGLAVITGTEYRQHAYVALTRGTDANLAYVLTVSRKRADPAPGPRPAPELARYAQIHTERDGVPAPPPHPASPGTALGVLGAVDGPDVRGMPVPAITTHSVSSARGLAVTKRAVAAATWRPRQRVPNEVPRQDYDALALDGMSSAELIFTIVSSTARRVDWWW